MAWNDRIREAAYTSPSGTRIVFDYEDVSFTVDKNTAGFNFPDADGTYVQDLGHSGRKYPLRMIFWGDDYDTTSNTFEAILLERGQGKLEHPIYGVIDVVPYGTISRRDDLKTASNQAIFEVTFWETIGLVYPASQDDAASNVITAIEAYNEINSEEFAEEVNTTKTINRVNLRNASLRLLKDLKTALQPIADTQANVKYQFDTIFNSINGSIDILIGEPVSLASQTIQIIQAPARAQTLIADRIAAYQSLVNTIIGAEIRNTNEFHISEIYGATYVTGSILAAVNNQFDKKVDALSTADSIISQFDSISAWREANYALLGEIDTGAAYQQLQSSVAIAAGYLVDISFSLKQENSIVIDRPRTIIDLSAELYGSVDDNLDFIINSNNLTGSEILELPRGREIVYYI